ncbi:conserved hypothetical protein [Paraburkholderia phytofirmans PsJN]|uniref:DUF3304 domain-containing protein n=2 Tax=Paraburkholderia phytofirmans TaxID=261302 RepID=B2T5T3_PARPJ|nr:conserved hypothetical protein [Paraburkholderia phytofirmans PsJN]
MADLRDARRTISGRRRHCSGRAPHKRSMATYLSAAALAASALLAVSACADNSLLPDDPPASGHPLWMVPISQTDRWAINMAVERYGMGDSPPHGGGGGAVCCYPSPRDWGKPVTVHWTWGTELDPKTKAVIKAREPHSMILHFPPGGPARDDRYLCLILREHDTAELAFSRAATRCATK